jgi:hypothetical protein
LKQTGDQHAAALFTPAGELCCAGVLTTPWTGDWRTLLVADWLPCASAMLLVSGRVSFEWCRKQQQRASGIIAAGGAELTVQTAENWHDSCWEMRRSLQRMQPRLAFGKTNN